MRLNFCISLSTRKQRIKSSSPEKNSDPSNKKSPINSVLADGENKLVPPQWVQCDLRNLNLSTLGKFTGKFDLEQFLSSL